MSRSGSSIPSFAGQAPRIPRRRQLELTEKKKSVRRAASPFASGSKLLFSLNIPSPLLSSAALHRALSDEERHRTTGERL
jgi:hypothetical protein